MKPTLSTNLDDPAAVPYFLWDDPMSVSELRQLLKNGSKPERIRLLGKVLREARDPDVWKFTTVAEILVEWKELVRHLGRRRSFWEFLLGEWRKAGLIHA